MEEDRNDVLRWVEDAADEAEHASLGAEAVFSALHAEHDHDHDHGLDTFTEAAAYTRRNLWDMSSAQYQALRRALDSINTATNPGWGRFWFLHRVLGSIVHSSGTVQQVRFLPWHRLMVWKFEQLLRSTSDGRGLYVPYWTWWQEAPTRRGVPAFWADYRPAIQVPSLTDAGLRSLVVALLGSSVRTALGGLSFFAMISHIMGALMRNGNSLLGGTIAVARGDRAALLRGDPTRSSEGVATLPTRADVQRAMRETTFTPFMRELEGGPHGGPHIWVGNVDGGNGVMGHPSWSPADVLFYFHHAEIDRLWWLWQQRRGIGTAPTVTGAPLPPWSERITDVMDIVNGSLGFAYENTTADDPTRNP